MILIVDDNKKYINRVIDLLEEAGLASGVITANDYDEAVMLIVKEKPGVVLLDINMPGKSGIEVLRFIKEKERDCKVIMASNHSNDSYRKLCQEEGADYFLDKSRDFESIPLILAEMAEQL